MKAPKSKFAYVIALGVALTLFSPALSANLTVSPSDDPSGVTDQANIKAALEAEKNGGTVVLAAGTFYLHKSIVVFDFDGTFRGAGKALTTVRTAPGVNFDVSPSLDAIAGFPPARGLEADMFLFPFNPSDEARTFRMSDMKIVVDQPAVDPPLNGFVDDRRAYLLNTMGAVVVINTDFVNYLIGEPFGLISVDAAVKDVEVEGIQDPQFRGFHDEESYDADNSIFGGIGVAGPNVGSAQIINAQVVNADFGLNLSDNKEALYESNVVENAAFGIEQFGPAVATHNVILDTRRNAVLFIDGPNSTIEANSIFGGGRNAILPVRSPHTNISNNTVTGNWRFGINSFFSDGCVVAGNHLVDVNAIVGPMLVQSSNCTVMNNSFVNVNSFVGIGSVYVYGNHNGIKNNKYTESGMPGWASGNGSVLLDTGFVGNMVAESLFPIVGGVQTTMCDQVLDLSGSGNNAQGRNAIPGYGVCNNNAEIAEHLRQVIEQRQIHMPELSGWTR